MKTFAYTFLLLIFISCKAQELNTEVENLDNWHFKSFNKDSVAGISMDKAFEFIKNKKGNEVVIAVIDSDVDINHNDIKSFVWENPHEIANNNLDDDKNGYIDDIYGWNFLRNKDGERINYSNNSHIEIIKAFDSIFKGKKYNEIAKKDSIKYKNYNLAIIRLKENLKYLKKKETLYISTLKHQEIGIRLMDSVFKSKNPSLESLDSLLKKCQTKRNKYLERYVKQFIVLKKRKYTKEVLKEKLNDIISKTKTANNFDFNDRAILGDNIYDITDENYGSNVISSSLNIYDHGTTVSGVIAILNKNKETSIKMMFLSLIHKSGGEKDKDIALAIRYAVNNGAKVINMSSSKPFSLNNEWIIEALKYAEKHNVFFVRSSGNDSSNNDNQRRYPNGWVTNKKVLSNYISVSSTGKNSDALIPKWSNYGKHTVDIFAPGTEITTLKVNGGYKIDSGTSMSTPMVSNTIALIMSYYPTLTTKEIKSILHKSVDKYDVEIKLANGKKMPFSDLSISGGILNTYKALKLAEKISEEKK